MKQNLYTVTMMHKETRERIRLEVWAEHTDEATRKVVAAIGGYNGEYSWMGSSPVYKNNQLASRTI